MGVFDDLLDDVSGAFTKEDGSYDISKILGAAGGAASLFGYDIGGSGGQQKVGYQGSIPTYTATRMQVPNTYDPNRRPGSGGQRYFTDIDYGGGDPTAQAAGLESLNRANLAAQNRQGQHLAPIRAAEAAPPAQQMAAGGIAGLKKVSF